MAAPPPPVGGAASAHPLEYKVDHNLKGKRDGGVRPSDLSQSCTASHKCYAWYMRRYGMRRF
jgi:hypothetical protein